MQKAVFLDRDGVINHNRLYYTYKIEDFEFNTGVFEALQQLASKGYIFIIITNQGGISKGIYSHADVHLLHEFMVREFASKNITISEVYYCPHHSDLENCLCRKPGSLNIEKAVARFNIDASKSYFIGDSPKDVLAAEAAGLIPIKIEPNQNLLSVLTLID